VIRRHLRQGVVVVLLVTAAVTTLAVYRAREAMEKPEAPAGPPPPPPPADRTDVMVLPPYVINVAYGAVDLSTDAGVEGNGPPLVVSSGDVIEIVVRPERAFTEPVTVRVYWNKGDRMKRWRPSLEKGPHSTYRYRGLGERPFGRGRGQIVAVVSPVADVPDDLPVSWVQKPPRHWAVVRQNVVWK
jgi:hypothetical protein